MKEDMKVMEKELTQAIRMRYKDKNNAIIMAIRIILFVGGTAMMTYGMCDNSWIKFIGGLLFMLISTTD